jgi:DNA repair protein RecO (recombination protein O)
VVLRAREFGESDKIVTVLSRQHGKFTGIAKGAKRSRRRFAGTLEIFSHILLEYRLRGHAELVFLERAVLIRPWRSLFSSLEGYAAACHVVEVADKMTVEREVGDELYALVVAVLSRLDIRPPNATTLRLFELAALAACGYRHDLARCGRCRASLERVRLPARIPLSGGGLLCTRCGEQAPGGLRVSPDAALHLARLAGAVELGLPASGAAGDPAGVFAEDQRLDSGIEAAVARELRAATMALLEPHLRARLRTLELMNWG